MTGETNIKHGVRKMFANARSRVVLAGLFSTVVWSVCGAGGRLQLVPAASGPYTGGEVLSVDVYINQDPGGSAHALRLVQLDLSDSSLALLADVDVEFDIDQVSMPTYNILDWHPVYVAYSQVTSTPPPGFGLLVLPDSGMLHIGTIAVTLPIASGCYRLDVLNCDDTSIDFGAQVQFGFGTPGDPVTVWRCSTGDLVGCPLELGVGSQCPVAAGDCPNSIVDCKDDPANNACNCMQCTAGCCTFTCTKFGNTNCDAGHLVNLDDILYVLAGFSGGFTVSPNADINPCGGNGIINLDDILSTLSAFTGNNLCGCNQAGTPPLCGGVSP